MLFREINRDTGKFTNFIVKSGNLVSDIAQRSADLSGLVQHLSTTTGALAAQRTALGQSIQRLPGVHAPGQHDVRQPAQRARRRPAAGRRLQAGRAEAAEAARPAQAAGRGLGPDRPRPGEHRQPARGQQRPDRADQARRAAGRRRPSTTSTPTASTRPGAFPQSTIALNELDAGARHRAPVRGRPDRLVRGLHAPGHDRRQRRLEPGRADRRRRLDPERHAQPAAARCSIRCCACSAPSAAPAAQSATGGAADHRPGRPLPRLDGARRDSTTRRAGSRATRARCRPGK